MTLFFDIKKIESVSKHRAKSLKYVLYCLLKNKPIRGVLNNKTLIGNSWLLNPNPLLESNTVDILYVHQYIRLAALRSYTAYKLYGAKYLNLSDYSEIDINAIKHNPLFEIKQDKIYFKYEELN